MEILYHVTIIFKSKIPIHTAGQIRQFDKFVCSFQFYSVHERNGKDAMLNPFTLKSLNLRPNLWAAAFFLQLKSRQVIEARLKVKEKNASL